MNENTPNIRKPKCIVAYTDRLQPDRIFLAFTTSVFTDDRREYHRPISSASYYRLRSLLVDFDIARSAHPDLSITFGILTSSHGWYALIEDHAPSANKEHAPSANEEVPS